MTSPLHRGSTVWDQYHLQTTTKSFRFRCPPRNSDNWSGLWEYLDYAKKIPQQCIKTVSFQMKIGRMTSFKAYRMYHATDTCCKKWRLSLFHVFTSKKWKLLLKTWCVRLNHDVVVPNTLSENFVKDRYLWRDYTRALLLPKSQIPYYFYFSNTF